MHPVLIISDSIALPVYLIIISLTYCFCVVWLVYRVKNTELLLRDGLDIGLSIMIGGLIGARFMHVFYENFNYYLNNPTEIFAIWNGGFVFYGGAMGALVASIITIKAKKLDFYAWADVYAPLFPFGYAFGRLACFFNGCCYGSVCALPWAVNFPHLEHARHPTQLYALAIEVLLLACIIFFERVKRPKWLMPAGQLFFFWSTGHAVNRIIMETYRDDYRGDFIFGFSISSWISVIILLLSAHYLYHNRKHS